MPMFTLSNRVIAVVGAVTLLAALSGPALATPEPGMAPALERWRQAVEAKLTGLDVGAAPVAPPVGAGASLRPGATGERVDRLAVQLTARGLLPAGTYAGTYDEAVEGAVREFQTREGMVADGVAGEGTVEALDRGPAATAEALKATLSDMTAFAAHTPGEFFLVNVPSQTAHLIQGGQVVMTMRVAVGRPSRPTPLLSDRITDVIVNPTWTAPTTVLAKDKLPSLRRTGHPGIEGATIYLDGQEVDPATVDWSTVSAERLRVVQSPGDQNALGRFKFNMTNGDSIYLHDTNDHSVFARVGRALSSGCVRLAEPRRLAETLLGREGWTPERITHALETGHTQGIGLSRPLPVRIVYWRATVDETGSVRVHRDIYGRNPQAAPVAAASQAAPVAAASQVAPVAAVPQATPAAVPAPAAEVAPLREMRVGDAVIRVPVAPAAPAPVHEVAAKARPRDGAQAGWGLY